MHLPPIKVRVSLGDEDLTIKVSILITVLLAVIELQEIVPCCKYLCNLKACCDTNLIVIIIDVRQRRRRALEED